MALRFQWVKIADKAEWGQFWSLKQSVASEFLTSGDLQTATQNAQPRSSESCFVLAPNPQAL